MSTENNNNNTPNLPPPGPQLSLIDLQNAVILINIAKDAGIYPDEQARLVDVTLNRFIGFLAVAVPMVQNQAMASAQGPIGADAAVGSGI